MNISTQYYSSDRVQCAGAQLFPPLGVLQVMPSEGGGVPVVDNGRLILISKDGYRHMRCYEEGSMKCLWRSGENVWSAAPVVSGDCLITGVGGIRDRKSALIRLSDGEIVRSFDDSRFIGSCVSGQRIYFRYVKEKSDQFSIGCANAFDMTVLWDSSEEKFDRFAVSGNYVGLKHLNGNIVSLDSKTGELLWRITPLDIGFFKTQREIDETPSDVYGEYIVKRMKHAIGYPCIYNNKVVVSPTYGNNIVGLDAKTGKVLWMAHLEYTMCTRLQAYGDEIYSSGGRYIEAHSMATGERTRLIEIDQDSYANATGERSPAMSDFTLSDTHVFGFKTSPDPIFYSVNKENGAVEWAYKPDKPIRDADHPYICNGRIYYRTLGGLYIFEGADGYLGS